jgi:hypothetical protein
MAVACPLNIQMQICRNYQSDPTAMEELVEVLYRLLLDGSGELPNHVAECREQNDSPVGANAIPLRNCTPVAA